MALRNDKKLRERSNATSKNTNKVTKSARKPVTRATSKRMDAISLTNQTTSPLLRLPRELRDIIYEYAIGGNEFKPPDPTRKDSTMYKGGRYYLEGGTEDDWPQLFSLSRACRQLHAETRLLPYSLNVFQVAYGAKLDKFLPRLKEEYKKAITMLSFGFKGDNVTWLSSNYHSIHGELEKCSNLKLVILRDGLTLAGEEDVRKFVEGRKLALIEESDPLDWTLYGRLWGAGV